jgi:hypothetical protein
MLDCAECDLVGEIGHLRQICAKSSHGPLCESLYLRGIFPLFGACFAPVPPSHFPTNIKKRHTFTCRARFDLSYREIYLYCGEIITAAPLIYDIDINICVCCANYPSRCDFELISTAHRRFYRTKFLKTKSSSKIDILLRN